MYALVSLGLRVFCVIGAGQCEQPRGRMYVVASLGLRVFCVAGVRQYALGICVFYGRRWIMYAVKGSDIYPGVARSPRFLRGRHGRICAAKGSDVRPGVPRAPLF